MCGLLRLWLLLRFVCHCRRVAVHAATARPSACVGIAIGCPIISGENVHCIKQNLPCCQTRIGGGLLAICAVLAAGAYALGYTTKGGKAPVFKSWCFCGNADVAFKICSGSRIPVVWSARCSQWRMSKAMSLERGGCKIAKCASLLSWVRSRHRCTSPRAVMIGTLAFLASVIEHQCVISFLDMPKDDVWHLEEKGFPIALGNCFKKCQATSMSGGLHIYTMPWFYIPWGQYPVYHL